MSVSPSCSFPCSMLWHDIVLWMGYSWTKNSFPPGKPYSLVHLPQWTANILSCSICAMAWKMLESTETNPEAHWEHLMRYLLSLWMRNINIRLFPFLSLSAIYIQWKWFRIFHLTTWPTSHYQLISGMSLNLYNLHRTQLLCKSKAANTVLYFISRIYSPYNWVLVPVSLDSEWITGWPYNLS